MENKSRVLFAMFLVTALSISDFVKPGLAEVQQPQQFSGLFPSDFPIDLSKCWSTLINIPGCLLQISTSIFSGQFGSIGIPCCKEFLAVSESCLPQMFPLTPFIAPLLKDSCSRTVTPPTKQ
ncbi:PREDICTED: uncharacterized protein LOC104809119 [Tarenaya hassleriana]|uniref:uncharacterized protein LOC104809119 n=1 Tax=Tarenaya hassleriana TaxID=28532 RepID=UPI00053C72E5|nr:PREDICTED: uncharacterized protein LOC104809119 [Tarenaya hassleriana]